LAGDESGQVLKGLFFSEQRFFGAGPDEPRERWDEAPVFLQTLRWLDRYFAGDRPEPEELPLAPDGSPFLQKVWMELQKIPYGTLTTYGELAVRLGTSARAVGGAVGRNPVGIIIPCHRVIGAGGKLTGFSAGLEIKRYLLRLEGRDISG